MAGVGHLLYVVMFLRFPNFFSNFLLHLIKTILEQKEVNLILLYVFKPKIQNTNHKKHGQIVDNVGQIHNYSFKEKINLSKRSLKTQN